MLCKCNYTTYTLIFVCTHDTQKKQQPTDEEVSPLLLFPMMLSHSDAGRLFLVESVPKFTKDASAPMLRLFTQVSGSEGVVTLDA